MNEMNLDECIKETREIIANAFELKSVPYPCDKCGIFIHSQDVAEADDGRLVCGNCQDKINKSIKYCNQEGKKEIGIL